MENIILEMKKIVEDSKDEGLTSIVMRNKLKEYLHYFVLDCVYNSEFKDMIFYGGSCLRIVYGLDRMSIDLDFEAGEKTDFLKLKKLLKKYFSADLKLGNKFSIKGEKKSKSVSRIFLNFPVMNEIGLSPHKDEVLNIRIDIMSVPRTYLNKLNSVFTLKSKYGKSFAIKHYDVPTLFASKLAAILDRDFSLGRAEEKIDFKGRDFYDLWWYMEKGVLPNSKMLKLKNIKKSVGDIFDEISIFISQKNMTKGLKKDLEPLFPEPHFVENFVNNFRSNFQELRRKRYITRKIKFLDKIRFGEDSRTDVNFFRFEYLCEDETKVKFLFKLSDAYWEKLNNMTLPKEDAEKTSWESPLSKDGLEWMAGYIALFLSKINNYLKRHNSEVYFTWWESKLIKMTDKNFNPEKEIIFPSGQELALNKKATLEILSL